MPLSLLIGLPTQKKRNRIASNPSHHSRKKPRHTKPSKDTPTQNPIPPHTHTRKHACQQPPYFPTPHTLHTLHPPTINPQLSAGISKVISSSLAKGTFANYQSAINSFLRFCDNHRIHNNLRFPADELVLSAFAASLAGSTSGSYANSIFSGLKSWHTLHNAPWKGSNRTQLLLRGVARLAPPSSNREPRPPVTTNMLADLRRGLDLNRPKDTAIFAAALTAFWGQCRLGELLGSSRQRHDHTRLPSRSSISNPISANGSYLLTLPSTKSQQNKGEKVAITRQQPPIDPIHALQYHLAMAPHLPPTSSLFAYPSTNNSTTTILTKEIFITRINEIWSPHGLPRITGHSFRIGGTSALLKAGVSPDVVRSMGRWSSDAHFRYWRDLADIATTHAEYIHGPSTPATTSQTSARPFITATPRSRAARVISL
ncbi:reverse transcriptase domain containing protein [Ceratobasidium theobromae]|uniref:Reverse transcriptase domain containing protein n=1 Tax=Ceratobasidium theobromae TaxID=1582974 RepID=A0A5N5Q926_9AGAM|nr:reverse transcriptase domain containing protein [Ceratobasidium theobromae]